MTDIEHAKKYAEESISLAISKYNPKAEIIAETACLYGLTFKNVRIEELEKENKQLRNNYDDYKTVAEEEITHLKGLLLELYDCIPSSMADSCRETLQKVALVFKED